MEKILTSNGTYLSNAKESIRQYDKVREYQRSLHICEGIRCVECILLKICSGIPSDKQRYRYFLDYVKQNSFTNNIEEDSVST